MIIEDDVIVGAPGYDAGEAIQVEVFVEDQLRINDQSVEGRARGAEQVLERIRRLPGDLERSLYLKKLATLTSPAIRSPASLSVSRLAVPLPTETSSTPWRLASCASVTSEPFQSFFGSCG